MKLSYNPDSDVLYVTFGRRPPKGSVFIENRNGDIIRLDKKTRKVIGCTIPFFSRRAGKDGIPIPEIGDVPFNRSAKRLAS
jgi:uncharacterized protein YuzE